MIFSELDHRLSVVKRWSVVGTIRAQSVAEHSFNVALIAERIARRRWPDEREAVLMYALYHDHDESVTGDFPSYMKPHVQSEAIVDSIEAYDDEELSCGDVSPPHPLVKFIVKCADYIEACVFLRMEISMGNKTVAKHLRVLESRFRQYIEYAQRELTTDAPLVYDWYAVDVVDGMFNTNGQYVSEIHGFPR